MSIERANFNMPARMSEESLPQRYRQPGVLTESGQIDRRHEGQHVVRMRDLQRQAIEAAAEQAKEAFEFEAWQEARGRALSDAKYQVLRNHKESAFLAEQDPVLQAEFGVLDDEYYRDVRLRFNRWE